MSPTPAPIIEKIPSRALTAAAAKMGRFHPEQARLALGAISNLYCLYALENTAVSTVLMRGFTCERIAEYSAVIAEIGRAVPLRGRPAEELLAALAQSLDHAFASRQLRQARVTGFGILERVEAPSSYRLTIELPLAGFLRTSAA